MVAHTLQADIPSVRGAVLSIHEVSHWFELRRIPAVLEHIGLRLEPGGSSPSWSSGCGKSTLLRLLGLDFPAINNYPWIAGDYGPTLHASSFSGPASWRTVWSNVALGLEARGLLRSHRERVDDVLRLVGLAGFPTPIHASFPAEWRNARLWRPKRKASASIHGARRCMRGKQANQRVARVANASTAPSAPNATARSPV